MSFDFNDDDLEKEIDFDDDEAFKRDNKRDEVPEDSRIEREAPPERESDSDSDDDFFKDEDFEFADYTGDDIEDQGYRSKKIRERRKKRKLVYTSIAIVLIVIVAAAGAYFGYKWVKNKFFSPVEITEEERISVPETLELNQDLNISIAGAGHDLMEPDINSIIFTSYYSTNDETRSICLPIKTLMDVPGIGAELIGRSVSIGGMDLLSLTLEKGLGLDMQVDYYLLMDVEGIVDKLGGIELDVDTAYVINNYDDNSTFTLEPGVNLIDGSEALNTLKYFSGIEDPDIVPLTEMDIQKKVIDSIIDRIVGEDEESLTSNLNQVKDLIDSDMSLEDMMKLFSTFSGIDEERDMVYTLEASNTELDEEGIVYLPDVSGLSELFNKEEAVTEEEAAVERTMDVVILNGVGTPGIAGELADILNAQVYESGLHKYNVPSQSEGGIGNADNFNYDTTEIIVYASQDASVMAAANELKEIMGVGIVVTEEDEVASSDIAIILGSDYSQSTAEETEPVEVSGVVDVAVLNGVGVAGIAASTSEKIEDHFNAEKVIVEIIKVWDADNYNYTQTEIITYSDEEGMEAFAQQIQEELGVGVIKKGENSTYGEDITVIIGSDYTSQ